MFLPYLVWEHEVLECQYKYYNHRTVTTSELKYTFIK